MLTLTTPHRGPVTQRYGNPQPDGHPHTGQDYGYTGGGQVFPDVFAAAAGTVLYAGDSRALGWPNPWWFNPDFDRTDAVDSSAGNVIVIAHPGYVTTYSHLESWSVVKGQSVQAGQVIAGTGSTGRSTGKHLHFELLAYPFDFTTATYGRVDPNPYITKGEGMSAADVDAIVKETNKQAEETRRQVKEALRLAVGAIAQNDQDIEDVTREFLKDRILETSPVDLAAQINAAGIAQAVRDELVKLLEGAA